MAQDNRNIYLFDSVVWAGLSRHSSPLFICSQLGQLDWNWRIHYHVSIPHVVGKLVLAGGWDSAGAVNWGLEFPSLRSLHMAGLGFSWHGCPKRVGLLTWKLASSRERKCKLPGFSKSQNISFPTFRCWEESQGRHRFKGRKNTLPCWWKSGMWERRYCWSYLWKYNIPYTLTHTHAISVPSPNFQNPSTKRRLLCLSISRRDFGQKDFASVDFREHAF